MNAPALLGRVRIVDEEGERGADHEGDRGGNDVRDDGPQDDEGQDDVRPEPARATQSALLLAQRAGEPQWSAQGFCRRQLALQQVK